MHGSIINAVASTIAENIIRTAEEGEDITAIATRVNDTKGWDVQYRVPGGEYTDGKMANVFQGSLSDDDLKSAIEKAQELA